MPTIKADPGDCILSLAAEHGHHPDTIWDASANKALHAPEGRGQREIIAAGSSVSVPDRAKRQETRPPEVCHKFRALNTPVEFVVRFLDAGTPRAGLGYILVVDTLRREGMTDNDGILREPIPPQATLARVRLGDADSGEDYCFKLGFLAPAHTIAGAQARLTNLGFKCGPIDGVMGPQTRAALRKFQTARQIPVTGEPDQATKARLASEYGC
jgi:hypothetical protein